VKKQNGTVVEGGGQTSKYLGKSYDCPKHHGKSEEIEEQRGNSVKRKGATGGEKG